ncbi:transposase [Streptomyces sp. NBC_00425]|uniref:transposase n=1 Tax=Streptomyces sp. NBC_00425 TaxID=2975740 RepID=UPI003FCCAB08
MPVSTSTVKYTRTCSALYSNRRSQPRTVSNGRPSRAAIVLAPAPDAFQTSADPITSARSTRLTSTNTGRSTQRLHSALRASQMRHLPLVEEAMGRQALALLRQLEAACASADDLAEAAVQAFEAHAGAEIITGFPGLGPLSGARVLAEIGDDRPRFADARGLKAYAGSAPVTRACGKSVFVAARRVKNQRQAGVGYMWAFSAMAHPEGARAHYDRRREAGDRHAAAQRNLFNRMIGCLHHCLAHHVPFNEAVAFPTSREPVLPSPLDTFFASDVFLPASKPRDV